MIDIHRQAGRLHGSDPCVSARVALFSAFVLLLGAPGCSLSRAALGAHADGGPGPVDGAMDVGIDAATDTGPIDVGVDANADADLDAAPLDTGVDGGPPDVGQDAATCTPTCSGSTLTGCGADRVCALGCVVDRWRDLLPSNVGGRVSFAEGTTPLTVAAFELLVLNTDDGTIDVRSTAAPETVIRTVRNAGPGIIAGIPFTVVDGYGVFTLSTLDVPAAAQVAGRGARPLILLASGAVTIGGVVSVAADALRPGAGGGAGGTIGNGGSGTGGGGAGTDGPLGNDGGGSGASFGAYGAIGGGIIGGLAPASYGTTTLSPLVAGSGGGGSTGARGGHGGGGLQISSNVSIVVASSGGIDASGAGGAGGARTATDGSGGGGGGSGGAVLLEAPTVVLNGVVAALGAAGGQGAACEDDTCDAGATGASPMPFSRTAAPSSGAIALGGGGGGGSAIDSGTPVPGGIGQNGGGGGGAAGRIRIQTSLGSESYTTLLPSSVLLSTVGRISVTPP